MDQNIGRTDLLPASLPAVALVLMAVGALAVWAIAHRVLHRRRDSVSTGMRLVILAPVGMVASWCLLQALARPLFLSGPWPLWLAAFVIGVTVEGVSLFYERECAVVRPGIARTLVLMRLLALATTLFILMQPVLVRDRSRPIRRRVAVLVDQSASMQRTDAQWTLPEMLDMAQALGSIEPGERPLAGLPLQGDALRARFAYWRQLLGAGEGAAKLDLSEVASLAADTKRWVASPTEALTALLATANGERYKAERDAIDRLSRHARDALVPALEVLTKAVAGQGDLQAALVPLADSFEQFLTSLPAVSDAADTLLWDGLPADRQERIARETSTPREALARQLLAQGAGTTGDALLARLRSRYDVDLFRFGREALRVADAMAFLTNAPALPAPAKADAGVVPDTKEEAFQSVTDLTKALEDVLGAIPSEELAGVLVLGDGRHTGESGVEAVSRRLGQARVPVSTVVVGGTRPPFDTALADLRAPESVFLGDRVRFVATVTATGGKGRSTALKLMLDDQVLAEEKLAIDSDDWTQEVRLADIPEEQGVRRYRIVLDTLDGEKLADNNAWDADVSVSDDRTNVLLVDQRPCWEFRYLRNLFYGRDKSVHLQYVLMEPDLIADQEPRNLPAASAARKFGEAEAGALPVSREEWRKFDVIILGDLDETVLTPEVVADLKYCVEDRGALLVVVAGPENMPRKIRNPDLQALLPVSYEPGDGEARAAPEPAFRIQLTPAGRGHEVMRQSASPSENEQVWSELPDLHWRFPLTGVKPGAEVLAYAEPVDADAGQAVQRTVSVADESPEETIRRLAAIRDHQARNALVVVQTIGQGRSLMLATDRTWRLRYRVGDTRHHRFWGQIMRWGVGEKLRAGNAFVRLGTDQLRYTPNEPIRIVARLSDTTSAPLTDARVEATVARDGKLLHRVPLRFRAASNGIYEGVLDPLPEAGLYDVSLRSPEAESKLGADFPEGLATRFVVVTARRPAEFVNVTADWQIPRVVAQLSAGRVVRPSEALGLWDSFGEGSRVLSERVETLLWDSPWLFLAIVLLLTIEWLLRKKGGLA